MLSRVADSLFWMSRYLERAEHVARVVNVNLNLALDRSLGAGSQWRRLLDSLPEAPFAAGQIDAGAADRSAIDRAFRDSTRACIGAARENARQVREEISTEMWEEVNRLYLTISRAGDGSAPALGTHEFMTATVNGVQMFQGVTDATMTHGEGWLFMDLGRYLERAGSTAALLAAQYSTVAAAPDDGVTGYVEWVGLLKSCCAFEAYCRHYTADVRPDRIAEFLVLNSDFPRSIHFAAGRIKHALHELSSRDGNRGGRADRLAGRLTASLDYGQIDEIIGELPAYLNGIIRQTSLINAAAYQQYIAYPIDAALSAS
mgnify:CR=1 FL=1